MPYELLIALLTGLSVVLIGGAVMVVRSNRRAPLAARLQQIQTGGTVAPEATGGPQVAQLLGRVGAAVAPKGPSVGLQQRLAHAGFHDPSAAKIFMGTKFLLFAAGLPLSAGAFYFWDLPSLTRLVLVFSAAALCFFLPNFYVDYRRSQRRMEVRIHLPDAIDLLEVCVSAGMGLDMAWNSVTDEVRTVCPTLADEMALTDLEIHLGSPRAAAMRHMADRTASEDLASLVAILVQSERFGTSMSEALRAFANAMREHRSQRAQEYAEKMAVKLLFPLVLFIFPAVMIVMVGPAVMTLYKALMTS